MTMNIVQLPTGDFYTQILENKFPMSIWQDMPGLPDGVFGFTRGTGSDAVTVIANLTAAEQEVGLPTEGPLREFFTGQILSAGSRAVLPAWGWLVLTPEKE